MPSISVLPDYNSDDGQSATSVPSGAAPDPALSAELGPSGAAPDPALSAELGPSGAALALQKAFEDNFNLGDKLPVSVSKSSSYNIHLLNINVLNFNFRRGRRVQERYFAISKLR
jgi:hypothetical protein